MTESVLSYLVEKTKNTITKLETELRDQQLILQVLEKVDGMDTEDEPESEGYQSRLDGKPVEPRLEEKFVVKGRPTGTRGKYERHIKRSEFASKICRDIQAEFINELSADRDTGVPVLYITEQLGANRNNGYYAAKKLVDRNPDLAYVKYNGWPQRKGYIVGIMSVAHAKKLLLNLDKEVTENGSIRDEETGDS